MELAKKSYVESYLKSKIIYIDAGGLGTGTYTYPELSGAYAVILILRYEGDSLVYTILAPDSFQITDNFTITYNSLNQIIIDKLNGSLKLYGLLIFK